ncbi:pirin family protein [Dermacoccaceae bacterium W4C1]
MSNLARDPEAAVLRSGEPCTDLEVLTPRAVPLGGPRGLTVHRTLPQRSRSLVGSWCFLDHYGPDPVARTGGMRVPRHPHTGLATVSWLFSGEIDHLDSGGTAAAVRPGELNLMIAGRGITHSEISTAATTTLHGVQLWYALPESTRFSDNAFHHYVPEPVELPGVVARVFLGELLGSESPVDTRTAPMLGAELTLEPDASVTLECRPDFEHAFLCETGAITVNDREVGHRELAFVPTGADTAVLSAGPKGARVILIGGVPLGEEIVMWWNFVGRSHEEIVDFRARYQQEMGLEPAPTTSPAADEQESARPGGAGPLFGDFPDGEPDPLPAPELPNTRLRSRG